MNHSFDFHCTLEHILDLAKLYFELWGCPRVFWTNYLDLPNMFSQVKGVVAFRWIHADHGSMFGLIILGIDLVFLPNRQMQKSMAMHTFS